MKVTFVTPLVERDVNIQMTESEAEILRIITYADATVPKALRENGYDRAHNLTGIGPFLLRLKDALSAVKR